MKRPRGEYLILCAAVLWGTTGAAQALAPPGAAPVSVGAVRLALGGLALLGIAIARRTLSGGRPWPPGLTLLAAACIAGYQICFFAAVATTGVAVGTIVGIGSAPVLAGALAWLVQRVNPGRRWAAATALAVLGCTLLALSGGEATFRLQGIFLALGAGACYALYTLASKRLLENRPPEAVMAVVFCLGALLLSPALLLADPGWLGQPGGLAVALHLGLVTTALAYTLFGRGLRSIPAASAVTLSLAEPLTAGLLGVFLLGEKLAPQGWAGILLLFTGLMLISFQENPDGAFKNATS
jgi:DME family drug/metabolite transporter